MRPARKLTIALSLLLAAGLVSWAATPNLRVFFASDFTDQAYQQKTFEKVAKAWKRPSESPEPGSKSVVISTILRDGSLLERKLHYKSGSDAWDKAAMQAVKDAAPFSPLPKTYKGTSVEVHFHFELNK